MKDGAEAFVLFLHGAQLVLRSSVLTVLNLDEVDIMIRILRSLGRCCLKNVDLLVARGAAKVLPVVSPICPLPLRSIYPPPLLAICSFFVSAEMGTTRTASGRLVVILFLFEKQGERATLVQLY